MKTIKFCFLILIVSIFVYSTSAQTPVIDSLINVLNSTNTDSIKVKLYGDISWELMSVDILKSQFYADKELGLATKIHNEAFIAQAESDIGNIFNRKGDFKTALVHYYKAAELRQKLKQPIKLAGVYNNIATVLMRQSNFNEAIEINFKSLKIFEKANDKTKQVIIIGNIGNIYSELRQNTQAAIYFRRGLNLSKETGDFSLEANSLVNIGRLKYEANEIDSALFYFYQAEKIFIKNNLLYNLGPTFNNIGRALAAKNDYGKAIEYYQKGLDNRIQFKDEYGIALSYLNIGGLCIKKKDYSKAINSLKKSEYIFKNQHAFINLKDCYLQLANAAEFSGDLNSAVNYYKLFSDYKDSIYTKESADQLLEMNAKYETEKKEQENKLLNIQNKLSEKTIKQQRIFSYFIVVVSLLLASLAFFIFKGLKQQKKANLIISVQKKEVETKSLIIEEKHREITDSINYAERIQRAVLPSGEYADKIIGNHFILFKPKDIVSGDFYWATRVNEWLIVTVADCTGHGVPGAFMSMLGISFLNEIVRKKEVTQASQVLDNLRESVIEALKQHGAKGEQKDGMDLVLIVINSETLEMQYAGANNPCYIIKQFDNLEMNQFENEKENKNQFSNFQINTFPNLIELKGDKMPVAIQENMKPFTNHLIQLQKGDIVYLASDGYEDQFGGPNRKKFLAKNLKNLLIANCQQPMAIQKQTLETTINVWKGETEQIDDITVMGIKI